jgi:hypothetical protein
MRRLWKIGGTGVLAISACASTSTQPATAIANTLPPPSGWWMTDSPSHAGEARRFLATEFQWVGPNFVDRVRTVLRASAAPDTWVGNGPLPYTVRRDGEMLILSEPPHGSLTLRPAHPDEAAVAEAALAQHGTIDVTCTRAARCFRAAAIALSPSHDDTREIVPGTHLLGCERIISGYEELFTRMGRTVPAECGN